MDQGEGETVTDGWRGNCPNWVRRVEPVVFGSSDPAFLRRIAKHVCDPRLLRPAIACAVPSGVSSSPVLWRDVQHVMLRRRMPSVVADAAWIGAAAYYVRQRPRIGASVVEALRCACRPNALRLALEDATWAPSGVSPDQDRIRIRTVHLLVAIDAGADRDLLCAAHAWLSCRPDRRDSTSALVRHSRLVFAQNGIVEAVASSSIKEGDAPVRHRFDPFVSETLRFFDEEERNKSTT